MEGQSLRKKGAEARFLIGTRQVQKRTEPLEKNKTPAVARMLMLTRDIAPGPSSSPSYSKPDPFRIVPPPV